MATHTITWNIDIAKILGILALVYLVLAGYTKVDKVIDIQQQEIALKTYQVNSEIAMSKPLIDCQRLLSSSVNNTNIYK